MSDDLKNFKDLMDAWHKEFDTRMAEVKKEAVQKTPEQQGCDHGVSFDEDAARKLSEDAAAQPTDPNLDPALAFIMGDPSSGTIRKRWPRLNGTCPKGCGYVGIAYASYMHYIMGDW